jgi:hypothetical protein
MFWQIVIGSGIASAIFAYTRGHSPLRWFFSSAVGLPLLTLVPPAKSGAIAERNRARREVGDKVGLVTGAIVAGTVGLLSAIGLV